MSERLGGKKHFATHKGCCSDVDKNRKPVSISCNFSTFIHRSPDEAKHGYVRKAPIYMMSNATCRLGFPRAGTGMSNITTLTSMSMKTLTPKTKYVLLLDADLAYLRLPIGFEIPTTTSKKL